MFCFNYLFIFLKSLSKHNMFDLCLGCVKDGSPHYELFTSSRTPSRTKRSTSFLNIYSFTFGTGCGLNNISFASSFNSKYTGSVFQVPSFLSNNYSKKLNNFSNSLRCVYVICWNWFSINLFKFAC